MKKQKTSYFCVPIAMALPIVFLILTGLMLYMAWWVTDVPGDGKTTSILFLCMVPVTLSYAAFTMNTAIWRVELRENDIVCRGWLPKQTFSLAYETCTIGMDWHSQNGGKVWWIYLCKGQKPVYRSKNPANRINALKCGNGFIRIMYSDEVYEALLAVLPRKQRAALESARKFAGFKQQGRII